MKLIANNTAIEVRNSDLIGLALVATGGYILGGTRGAIGYTALYAGLRYFNR